MIINNKKLCVIFFIVVSFCLLLIDNDFSTNYDSDISNNFLSGVNISNGEDAKPNDMPGFASINLESAYGNPNTQKLDGTKMSYGMCCGTLIAPSGVLTASHVCALVSYERKMSVSFFYTNKSTMNQYKNVGTPICFDPPNKSLPGNEKAFTVNVDKRIQFVPNDPYNKVTTEPGRDVALLHLQKPVTNIKPVSIAKGMLSDLNQKLSYCGGGWDDDNNYIYPKKLQLGITHKNSDDVGNNIGKTIGGPKDVSPYNNEGEYTIGGNNLTESHPYPGDSGSGLIEYINGKPYVCGIISRTPVDNDLRLKYKDITIVSCPGCDRFYNFIMSNIKN